MPATLCARVPDGVGLDEAAFATVGAVALQGVRQSGVTVGDRVAVIGLGLVGQLTVQLLRAAGCEVAGADLDAGRCAAVAALRRRRRDLGDRLGRRQGAARRRPAASATTPSSSPPAPRATRPSSSPAQIARDRGTVVVVGDVGMQVPRAPFYEKELTLKLSRSYGPGRYDPLYEEMAIDYPIGYVRWTEQRNMAEFLRLVAEGRVDVKPLITHRFAVDDAAQAYAAVTDPASGSLGVLLEYPQGEPERARIEVGRPAAGEPAQGAVGVGFSAPATSPRRRCCRRWPPTRASRLAACSRPPGSAPATSPSATASPSAPGRRTKCSATRTRAPSSSPRGTPRTPRSPPRRCGPARPSSSRSRWP